MITIIVMDIAFITYILNTLSFYVVVNNLTY